MDNADAIRRERLVGRSARSWIVTTAPAATACIASAAGACDAGTGLAGHDDTAGHFDPFLLLPPP